MGPRLCASRIESEDCLPGMTGRMGDIYTIALLMPRVAFFGYSISGAGPWIAKPF